MKKREYVVLDLESDGESEGMVSAMRGLESLTRSEMWIRAQVRSAYRDSDRSLLEMEGDFAGRYVIAEVVRVVQPQLRVSVTVGLEGVGDE